MDTTCVNYLDYAASTPLSNTAKEALLWYEQQWWAGANSNSLHAAGRHAFACLQDARKVLSQSIDASRPSELLFTSGGTESNALAIIGLTRRAYSASKGTRNRVLVSAIEHDSVLSLAKKYCSQEELRLDIVPVDSSGVVVLDELDSMLDATVATVSVMLVNNETGIIEPIAEIASRAHQVGAYVHTDAVQALGKIPLSVRELGVDSASFSGHKIGAPVGIGALYLQHNVTLEPLYVGGGQEYGVRPGTVDVCSAYAFSQAARVACNTIESNLDTLISKRNALLNCLSSNPLVKVTISEDAYTYPGIIHILLDGISSQRSVLELDNAGFAVSAGSACSSASLDPSHVLIAMGIPQKLAQSALRISYDAQVEVETLNGLAQAINSLYHT